MEINGLINGLKSYDRVDKSDSSTKKGKGSKSSTSGQGDSVKVSSKARLVASATSEAQSAPDIRQQKVNELKALVESGEYTPDLRKTAAKIVEEDLELLI
ncbi:flagellar biosynthesis anti-sigma factor FlgM [Desulfovibrio ferrophilus]|uniref:Negative regulator of flagellin synthesis n=1 Tax=Desulfovibrio ferrophilus TaxID=241368 RepID=A0A2Z6AXH8_9BACT|nr:flagellar biosynthesis anti-sigma factor FlgM [Desulfovibrio ferrophilus]BBD07903.1 putative anti-sigma-28 factor, FlgM family protein [Desulfovibrio ferrophilus]